SSPQWPAVPSAPSPIHLIHRMPAHGPRRSRSASAATKGEAMLSHRSFRRSTMVLLLGALALGAPSPACAVTILLDGAAGAVYDRAGDGRFFAGGPSVPPDGVGDLGGNAPAIIYQAGVVEMRALSEFPLAALAGYSAAEITSATLTVTIDDVLSTLGPGTS